MYKQKNKGFTLVELIVVITILAILGTIAFISMQQYAKSARDSARMSDMSKIKTTLELFHLDAGKYPASTDFFDVKYSGALAWTQGSFGNPTFTNVQKLDKVPLDPLTDREYIYSVTHSKQEFEIAGIMETYDGGTLGSLISNDTFAGDRKANLRITGQYNGKILKVSTGGLTYILAVPSIITSTGGTLKYIIDNSALAYDSYQNLPAQYSGSLYDVEGEDGGLVLVNPDYLEVFSGSFDDLNTNDSAGEAERTTFIENLQNAYSGTVIENEGGINNIVNAGTSDEIEFIATTIISNDLGGSIPILGSTSGDGGGDSGGEVPTGPFWYEHDSLSTIESLEYFKSDESGKMLFTSYENNSDGELWYTDGTKDGTVQILDGIGDYDSLGDYDYFAYAGGKHYFYANDRDTQYGMWVTDGTPEGTDFIHEIEFEYNWQSVYGIDFVDLNGDLLFTGDFRSNMNYVPEDEGQKLWISNGTTGGTQKVLDFHSNSSPYNFSEMGGKAYFFMYNNSDGYELFSSNGTAMGTTKVTDIGPGTYNAGNELYMNNIGGKLFFDADDGTNGQEVWVSDGSAGGTFMLKDINTGGDGSYPMEMVGFNNKAYFIATNGTNRNVYESDGTVVGTTSVFSFSADANNFYPEDVLLKVVNNKLVLFSYGYWNGSNVPTKIFAFNGSSFDEIYEYGINDDYDSENVVESNGSIFFYVDKNGNNELWSTDGTSGGTKKVNDIPNSIEYMIEFNGKIYFSIDSELWTSDGTESGTISTGISFPGGGGEIPS